MRFVTMMTSAAVLLFAGANSAPAAPHGASGPAWAVTAPVVATFATVQDAQPQPPAKGEVDVNVDLDSGGTVWYADPFWIAVGVIALVVIVLLVALAGRGGGTTVVR
jgi:hypothetical protein